MYFVHYPLLRIPLPTEKLEDGMPDSQDSSGIPLGSNSRNVYVNVSRKSRLVKFTHESKQISEISQ